MSSNNLAQKFADLQAERERTWAPEQLERNAAQRRVLVERDGAAIRPKTGDRLEPFTLIDAEGNAVSSENLLANGPTVLIFFRFGGCPACNIALPHYDAALWSELSSAGVSLYFASAQTPVDRGPTERHGLRFVTLSDPGYALGRKLGITFFPEDRPEVKPGEPWIGASLGTQSYEITQPAVVVIEPDHTVRFLDASPDWLARTEVDRILDALPEVRRSEAA